MCELCLSTVAIERYRRESRAVAVESFEKLDRVKNRLGFFLFRFSFGFLFSLELNLLSFTKNESLFVLFCFSRVFLPPLGPALTVLTVIVCVWFSVRVRVGGAHG